MQAEQGFRRARTGRIAMLDQGFGPSRIRTKADGTADRRILLGQEAVQNDLGGGVVVNLFIGQEGHQTLLQGAEAAFDLAFSLGARSH